MKFSREDALMAAQAIFEIIGEVQSEGDNMEEQLRKIDRIKFVARGAAHLLEDISEK